jgi:hypothetical protein
LRHLLAASNWLIFSSATCHFAVFTVQDPIFKGNKVPNPEMGYPGGIFDPLGFSKGNLKELQTKEIKNGRIAMIAFMSFVVQVRSGWDDVQRGGQQDCWWQLHEIGSCCCNCAILTGLLPQWCWQLWG